MPEPDSALRTAGGRVGITQEEVGVAIPTFRRPDQLRRALESALSQSQQPDRILVSDDGGQEEVCSLVESYKDSRLTYLGRPRPLGLAQNWTLTLQSLNCQYVALLEDDNFWHPHHLETAIGAFREYPHATIYHCPHREAWDDGTALQYYKIVRPPWHIGGSDGVTLVDRAAVFWDALSGGHVNSSTVVIRTPALTSIPPFDPRFVMGMDTLMWTRLALRGALLYSPYVGTTYTYHGRNASHFLAVSGRSPVEARGARRLLAKEVLGSDPSLFEKMRLMIERMSPEEAASTALVLLNRTFPRSVRHTAWSIVRERDDLWNETKYLRWTRVLGPRPLKYIDLFDSLRHFVKAAVHASR